MSQKSDKIADRLNKALGLFTILPAAMIPMAVAAQDAATEDAATKVGGRITVQARRVRVRVRPRLSIRVNSLRKIEGTVGIRVLTPNFDIKK